MFRVDFEVALKGVFEVELELALVVVFKEDLVLVLFEVGLDSDRLEAAAIVVIVEEVRELCLLR